MICKSPVLLIKWEAKSFMASVFMRGTYGQYNCIFIQPTNQLLVVSSEVKIYSFQMFSNIGQQQQVADFKKRRDAQTEKLRKTNREEIFSKKRNILSNDSKGLNDSHSEMEGGKRQKLLVVEERYRKEIETFLRSNYTMDMFGDLITNITEGDILNQHFGMIGIRKLLSIAENPPIQAVIDAGLVPKMIQYIKQLEYPQLQLEATWALTNVASGTTIQCQSIIDKGGIPLFVQLLKSNNPGIVEQAVWAIGNISSDCVFYRDNIIRAGGLINLVEATRRLTDEGLIKHCCWALSNLCRGSPLPKYDHIRHAIPILCQAIAHGKINDKEIIADCCWAISYHSDANRNKIQVVVDSGVLPRIVKNLEEPAMGLLIPSIRILGNISTGSVQHTEELIRLNVLPLLEKVLDHHKKVVRREVCWVLSNITAGSKGQVQAIMNSYSLIKRILELFETDGNDVKRQICYIFSNMAHSGDSQAIFNLYRSASLVRYYVNLFTVEDNKTIEVALECLFVILAHGDKFKGNGKNPLILELHSIGAVDVLEKLQYHKSDIVYENVSKILQTYFEIEDPLQV